MVLKCENCSNCGHCSYVGGIEYCDYYLECVDNSHHSNVNKIDSKIKIENNPLKPNHYNSGKYDVIWFCEHHKLDFTVGNIIKYVFRSGKKDKSKDIEDLEKAKEYIDRRIEYLKGDK